MTQEIESPRPLLVYEDEDVLVIEKPSGVLAVPGRGADKQDSVSARVQKRFPEALIVHRLDMATSGLMLMARSALSQRRLGIAFAEQKIRKHYVAVVYGQLAFPQDPIAGWGLIDLPIAADWPRRPLRVIDVKAGKPSQTRWQILEYDLMRNVSRLLLEPLTGRSHQIRVHLQALGHPIVGDALYAGSTNSTNTDRLLLHATQLQFSHPSTGKAMHFESAAPF